MNFSSLIDQIAKRLPDKIAIIENGNCISYSELWSRIEALTNSFFEIGLSRGDKIALILPNCKEFIYCLFAILRANIIAIPLDPSLTTRELKEIFGNSSPCAILTNATILANIKSNAPSLLINKIIISSESISPHDVDIEDDKLFLLGKLYKPKKYLPIRKFTTRNNQIASINYTYRGYGYPLGAVLTHGNYIHGAVGYIRLVQPELEQRFLLAMPISHIFTLIGCVVVPLLRGATVVIMKNVIPSHIFRVIQNYKIDFLVSVPTIYRILLRNYDKTKHDISSLKYGISGGAPMGVELYRDIKNRMKFQLLQGYGLTESMPVVCNPKERVNACSLGIPGHEVRVKIVDEAGKEKKAGKKGEILIGGPTIMQGYFNRQFETSKVLKNGWIYTGDIGKIDEKGYLHFDSLKKNIVKVGGNTVDLLEIKNVLMTHPGISDTKVYSKEHNLWGNIIEAKVYIERDITSSETDIKGYCRGKLAIYKIPRKIKIIKVKDENRAYITAGCVSK